MGNLTGAHAKTPGDDHDKPRLKPVPIAVYPLNTL